MIRRWSCLNAITVSLEQLTSFNKARRIILFKTAVSLKRFNPSITKFKRKSLARRKHKTNWLFYLNIFSKWSHDYQIQKQLIKFQYTNKIFLTNAFCYNFDYIRRRFLLSEYSGNESLFLFTAISKKIYFYFHPALKSPHSSVYRIFNIAYIFTNQNTFKDTPPTLLPICANYDNQFFTNTDIKLSQISQFTDFSIISAISIARLVEIYKIIIFYFYFFLIQR